MNIIKSKIKYLFIYFLLILSILAVPVNAQPNNRWYAGYRYFGYSGYAPWGVSGDILTVDINNIPYGDFGAEWITIILQYYPDLYWIQVGYIKRWVYWWTQIDYYVEKNDSSGHWIKFYSGPTVGTVHEYMIIHSAKTDPHYWDVIIDPGVNPTLEKELYVDPYSPKDLQAFIEITDPSISVPNSHFYNLCYFEGRSWPLWDRHNPLVDSPPFYLDGVSHHEFYAWTR